MLKVLTLLFIPCLPKCLDVSNGLLKIQLDDSYHRHNSLISPSKQKVEQGNNILHVHGYYVSNPSLVITKF